MSEKASQQHPVLDRLDMTDDYQLGRDCLQIYEQYAEACVSLGAHIDLANRGHDELAKLRTLNTLNAHLSDRLSTVVAAILGRLRDRGYETPDEAAVTGRDCKLMSFIGIMGANLGRSSNIQARQVSSDCSRLVKSS